VLDPGQLRTVQFVPGTPNKIFVGADRGVFVTSTASEGFWNRVSTTLPNALVMDMDYAAGTDTLYIGTMGRGAWSLAGASAIDLPPAARCRNVTVPADNMCQGTATPAQVDNASFDPEGLPVTLGPLSPAPPYPLGNTLVTLPVSSSGGDETCQATVTVADVTAPSITAPPARTITVCVNANIGTPTTSDNCGPVTVTSNAPSKFPLGTTTVTWTARDPAGNTRTATQRVTAVLGDDRSCCPAGTTIREGDNNRNTLRGTSGSDCILGKGGDDILEGLSGNDFISGGEGSDQITGGFGNDRINGGGGNDVIDGQDGNDFIDGQAGVDTCAGGPGTNTVICEVASGG
jgi:RTX calcium-binding nonapeptide repeat (4 copies)/HYR domain